MAGFAAARSWVVLLMVATITGCRSGHAANDDTIELEPARPRYVETREVVTHLAGELMRTHEVTGVSLALVDGAEIVWATGFGFANAELELPAGPRTIYSVGSITKPVTAAAVLQAVERGELELDQSLAELLPTLALENHAEREITLAQLLTHQSGLPSDWFVHDLSHEPPAWTEILAEIEGLALAQPVGELTMYSNLGMALAGAALERAAGQPYASIVTEALLRPAGMRTAYFVGGPEPEPVLLPIAGGPQGLDAVEHAAAYRQNQLRRDPEFRMLPAGGLRASVLDLAAFASLILADGRVGNEQLLAPATVELMLTPHNHELVRDLDHRFGQAWFLDHPQLDWVGRVAWHGGRTYYHHALILVLPDHDLAVVVASNSHTAGPVVEALAIETLLAALQEKHGLEPPAPATRDEHHTAAPELVDAFARAHAGDYVTSTGLSTISSDDAEVWSTSAFARSRLSLTDPDSATLEALPGARIRFVDQAPEHVLAIERAGVRRPGASRLGPPPPIPASWAAMTGRWTVEERPGEVGVVAEPSLRIVAGRLQLEYMGQLEHPPLPIVMVLEPIDDRRARIAGRGRGQGTLVEIRGDGADATLWWAGRQLRRVL